MKTDEPSSNWSREATPSIQISEAVSLIVVGAVLLFVFGLVTVYLGVIGGSRWSVIPAVLAVAGAILAGTGLREWRTGLRRIEKDPPCSG